MVNSPAEPIPSVNRPDGSALVRTTELSPAAGSFHCRAVIPQAITPNDFPRLLSLVQTLAPDTGSARQLGDGLHWEQDSGYSSLSLTINPEPSGTVIRADLRTDGRQVAFGLGAIGASLLAVFVAAATHAPGGPTLAIGLGTLAASMWIARRAWQASNRRSAEQLQHLVDQISAGLRGELD